jgi:hypothetical protein
VPAGESLKKVGWAQAVLRAFSSWGIWHHANLWRPQTNYLEGFRAVPQLTRSTLPKGPLTTKPGTYREALTNIRTAILKEDYSQDQPYEKDKHFPILGPQQDLHITMAMRYYTASAYALSKLASTSQPWAHKKPAVRPAHHYGNEVLHWPSICTVQLAICHTSIPLKSQPWNWSPASSFIVQGF